MPRRVSHNLFTTIIKISCHAHLLNQNKNIIYNNNKDSKINQINESKKESNLKKESNSKKESNNTNLKDLNL